jgi:hypothetical protein
MIVSNSQSPITPTNFMESKWCRHVMTSNPTKYEHILSYGFRGVVFTRSYYATQCIMVSYSTNFVESNGTNADSTTCHD